MFHSNYIVKPGAGLKQGEFRVYSEDCALLANPFTRDNYVFLQHGEVLTEVELGHFLHHYVSRYKPTYLVQLYFLSGERVSVENDVLLNTLKRQFANKRTLDALNKANYSIADCFERYFNKYWTTFFPNSGPLPKNHDENELIRVVNKCYLETPSLFKQKDVDYLSQTWANFSSDLTSNLLRAD